MNFVRRFQRDGAGQRDFPRTGFSGLTPSGGGLEREYGELIQSQLLKLAGAPDLVEVEVRAAGATPDGRAIYTGMLRLARWDRRRSLRILVALPLIEAKMRKSLESTWLGDVSQFGGLWLHASAGARGAQALCDVHDVIVGFEGGAKREATGGRGKPADLGDRLPVLS